MTKLLKDQLKSVQTKTNQRGVLALLVIGVAFVITGRALKPNEAIVNGTYRNQCCADVIVKNGHFLFGGRDVQFRLESMKFGITAFAKEPLDLSGGIGEARRRAGEEEVIGFERISGKFAFTLLKKDREVVFRQVNQ